MDTIKEHASIVIGTWGIVYSILPNTPRDCLLCLSTVLVVFQLINWMYRFYNWFRHYKDN